MTNDFLKAAKIYGPMTAALVVLLVAFRLEIGETFWDPDNLVDLSQQIAVNGILALGMTLVILAGGIDLSVGATAALSGATSIWLLAKTLNPAIAVAGGVAAGAACGLVNGLLTAHIRLPAFIVTLATQQVARGLAYRWTGGNPLRAPDNQDWFAWLGSGRWLGVPAMSWCLAACFVLGFVLLHRLRFGEHLYAVGGNREAARYTGIGVVKVEAAAYFWCGLFAGIAGVLVAAQLSSIEAKVGEGYELNAIAAAAVGGVSLSGGVGTMGGTLLGAAVIGVLNKGLNQAEVHFSWQYVMKGLVILAAVYFDSLRRRRNR